jgi:hypothetical protein
MPKAKALLETWSPRTQSSIRGQLMLGGCSSRLGDVRGATKAFDAVIARSPADARGYLGVIPALIAKS